MWGTFQIGSPVDGEVEPAQGLTWYKTPELLVLH